MTLKHTRIVFLFVLALTGAAGCSMAKKAGTPNHDFVRNIELTEREKTIASLSGDMTAVMELDFPEGTIRRLYLEEWVNGSKIRSDMLMEGEEKESLDCYISSDIERDEDGTWTGTRWKVMFAGNGVKSETDHIHTAFPAGKKVNIGTSGTWGENKEKRTAPTDGEYVLAVRSFQFGKNFIETLTCEELAGNDEAFRKYDYVVLIRLVIE